MKEIDPIALITILIATLTAIGIVAFKYHNTFLYYREYFYRIPTASLIFLLGWNSAIFYTGKTDFYIDWLAIISLIILIAFTKIVEKMSRTENTGYFGPEW